MGITLESGVSIVVVQAVLFSSTVIKPHLTQTRSRQLTLLGLIPPLNFPSSNYEAYFANH